MTTIAYSNGMIACDTQVSGGNSIEHVSSKILHKGGVTVGIAGSIAILNRLSANGFPKRKKSLSIEQYAVNKFVPFVRSVHEDAHGKSALEDDEAGSEFILVFEDGVATVATRDGSVIVGGIGNDMAIGSGSAYAMGAMFNGSSARQAIYAASQFDPYTGRDIVSLIVDS